MTRYVPGIFQQLDEYFDRGASHFVNFINAFPSGLGDIGRGFANLGGGNKNALKNPWWGRFNFSYDAAKWKFGNLKKNPLFYPEYGYKFISHNLTNIWNYNVPLMGSLQQTFDMSQYDLKTEDYWYELLGRLGGGAIGGMLAGPIGIKIGTKLGPLITHKVLHPGVTFTGDKLKDFWDHNPSRTKYHIMDWMLGPKGGNKPAWLGGGDWTKKTKRPSHLPAKYNETDEERIDRLIATAQYREREKSYKTQNITTSPNTPW